MGLFCNQPEKVLKIVFIIEILHRVPTDEANVQAQHFNQLMDFMSPFCVSSKKRMRLTEGNSHLR